MKMKSWFYEPGEKRAGDVFFLFRGWLLLLLCFFSLNFSSCLDKDVMNVWKENDLVLELMDQNFSLFFFFSRVRAGSIQRESLLPVLDTFPP